MKITPLQKKLLEQISINPNLSKTQYAEIIDSTYNAVKTAIHRLREGGALDNTKVRSGCKAGLSITEEYAGEHRALNEECESKGIPIQDVNHYWYKGEHFSIHVGNKKVNLWELKDRIIADIQKYSPKYPVIKYPKITDGHLLVVDPADIHIGKLCKSFETGDEYNHQIAIDRVKSGVAGLIQKSKGFPIEKILFVVGNDILHTDNAKSLTTSGTPQDTELMWYDAFMVAKKLLVECIEMLLTVAPVHIQYDPSNHDYVSGVYVSTNIRGMV